MVRPTLRVFDFIKQLAAMEGILLDPVYTGKAFYGLVEDIKKGKYSGGRTIAILYLCIPADYLAYSPSSNTWDIKIIKRVSYV